VYSRQHYMGPPRRMRLTLASRMATTSATRTWCFSARR
jgi:hypothetical protein